MPHANQHIVDIGNSSSKINAHCEGGKRKGEKVFSTSKHNQIQSIISTLARQMERRVQKKTRALGQLGKDYIFYVRFVGIRYKLYKHTIYATWSGRCASSHPSIIPECDVATYRCDSIRVGLFKRSMQGCKDTVDADNWPWPLPRSWQNPCHALPTKQSNYIPNWSFLWSHSSFSNLIAVKL